MTASILCNGEHFCDISEIELKVTRTIDIPVFGQAQALGQISEKSYAAALNKKLEGNHTFAIEFEDRKERIAGFSLAYEFEDSFTYWLTTDCTESKS